MHFLNLGDEGLTKVNGTETFFHPPVSPQSCENIDGQPEVGRVVEKRSDSGRQVRSQGLYGHPYTRLIPRMHKINYPACYPR